MVKKTIFKRMRNNEAQTVASRTISVLEDANSSATGLEQFVETLTKAEADLTNASVVIKGSVSTDDLERKNQRRRDLLIGLRMHLNGMSKRGLHAASVELLLRPFASMGDSLTRGTYESVTAAMKNLAVKCQEEERFVQAISDLGVGDWIAEWRAANEEFEQMHKQRIEELETYKRTASPQAARDLILEAIEDLELYLRYQIRFGTEAAYADLYSMLKRETEAVATKVRQRIATAETTADSAEPETAPQEPEASTA